jgi:uncharacterized protein (DUF39 family)
MTRSEAIAFIAAQLPVADEETVLTVAEILSDAAQPVRDLSQRERELVVKSKADFEAGRTYSTEEVFAHIDARRAVRRTTPDNA